MTANLVALGYLCLVLGLLFGFQALIAGQLRDELKTESRVTELPNSPSWRAKGLGHVTSGRRCGLKERRSRGSALL